MGSQSKFIEKQKMIDEILADLMALKSQNFDANNYAIDENIKFFLATRSFKSYLKWLIFESPKIKTEKLLELSDFHLNDGKWERILQKELMEIEKWKFPDLLGPLRKEILKKLEDISLPQRHTICVNLGAGSMEIDRQVIEALRRSGEYKKYIFIGIDNSIASINSARNNLSNLNLKIISLTELSPQILLEIKTQHENEQFIVVLLCNEALSMEKYFEPHSIDLLYFSKFKHHLPTDTKLRLDDLLSKYSNLAIEFDNLNGWFMRYVPIKSQWYQPVLLNGGIFSCLRNPTKKYLKSLTKTNWTTKYFPDSYLRIFQRPFEESRPETVPTIKKDIQEIIKAGLKAPSGDNCQPWFFKCQDNILYLYNDPLRDRSLYNLNQKASYFGHGAVIENLNIAASHFGYQTEVFLFPQSNETNLVAKINLGLKKSETSLDTEKLFSYIETRCTNRKKYKPIQLTDNQKTDLTKIQTKKNGFGVLLEEHPEKIKTLAEAVSINEQVLFENDQMREFFFNHINWTKEIADKKKVGFFIDTLELPSPAKIIMKLFKKEKFRQLFIKKGIPASIAKQNSKLYATASAFGIITMPDDSAISYLNAGRIMEKIWLKTTKMGLSLQLLTGIPLLMARIKTGKAEMFDPKQKTIIQSAFQKIQETFNFPDNKHIAVLFRIGVANKPSGYSPRFSLNEIIKP